MKGKILIALTILLSFCGCDAESMFSSDYACRFIFYTQYHPGTTIETALTGYGMYTMISVGKRNGVWHVYSTLNDGNDETEDITLTTAEENYLDYSNLGASNGIIVGLTNFSGIVAWDQHCSNCLRNYGGSSYPLSWTGNRQSVSCSKCGRTYSLETGAITDGDEGISLFRYRVSYSGTGSVLTVTN